MYHRRVMVLSSSPNYKQTVIDESSANFDSLIIPELKRTIYDVSSVSYDILIPSEVQQNLYWQVASPRYIFSKFRI